MSIHSVRISAHVNDTTIINMNFKISTNEKFTVITVNTDVLSDNLTAEFQKITNKCLQQDMKNVIVKLAKVTSVEEKAAGQLVDLQEEFQQENASFVVCDIQPQVKSTLEEWNILDTINYAPTESEAWDIVQMEELERELMKDMDLDDAP